MANIYPLRVFLYVALALLSAVLFGLGGFRLWYTTHLPVYDPLNDGVPFYDPIVAELLVTSFFTLLWSLFIVVTMSKRWETTPVSRFRGEFIGIFILWVLWLVGAAYSTTIWGDLKFCWDYRACRILTAFVAFAWIGWATLTIIGLTSIIFVSRHRSFNQPLHGRYYYDSQGRHVATAYTIPEPEMANR